MAREEQQERDAPLYYDVVQPLLEAHDGDPTELLRLYPHFDSNAIAEDCYGWSYLHETCYKNHFIVVRGLLACDANLLLRDDNNGWFPLICACCGHEEIPVEMVAWLLQNHEDARTTINWITPHGFSALHAGAMQQSIPFARMLLSHGADLTSEYKGHTPKQLAHYHDNMEMAAFLEASERTAAVLSIGEWRPKLHAYFPWRYRFALRTLLLIGKIHVTIKGEKNVSVYRYTQSCLYLLPEELKQYLYAYICAAPINDDWTRKGV